MIIFLFFLALIFTPGFATGETLIPEYAPVKAVVVSQPPPAKHPLSQKFNDDWSTLVGKLQSIIPVVALSGPLEMDKKWQNVQVIDVEAHLFIRDLFPLSISAHSLLNYIYELPFDSPSISGALFQFPSIIDSLPEGIVNGIEGGNILIGSENECFYSALSNSHTIEFYEPYLNHIGCSSVVRLDPIPHDYTKHIDMHIKFLGPKKVAISVYSNDNFDIDNTYVQNIKFPCKHDEPCSETSTEVILDPQKIDVFSQKNGFNLNEVKEYIRNRFNVKSFDHPPEIEDMLSKYHLRNVQTLKKLGYEVTFIENPRPKVGYIIFEYTDKKVARLSFTVPTYLNGLIVNGNFFMPSYPKLSTAGIESKAESEISKHFNVVKINADLFIIARGAIHCLTAEIH